jgi:hypothetical protein
MKSQGQTQSIDFESPEIYTFFKGKNYHVVDDLVLCLGSCFLSYTAKSSHHLMVAFTPKEALCQEEI